VDDGGLREVFMDFQVNQVQPQAESLWRLDPARRFVAGSSFGGLVSLYLALAYPEVYLGAATLSGAFWPGVDTGHSAQGAITATGHVAVALYLDHGGTEADGGDGYVENLEVRDLLLTAGWLQQDSSGCTLAAQTLCYFHDVGATHDELAWRARSWRWLRYFLGL
jgi:predicted alpha/beta superfamily hydrolase